jgi:ComEC/Rec2-related protein
VLGGLGATLSPARALVSGFLIGDVDALPDADAEALRAAGLSHFVAVSGSNVGLFLAAWWIVSGPLAWTPRRRAIAGLLGLAVFVVVTRCEPSVLRAAVMAGIVLGARLVGRVVAPWEALGWSVTLLVLIDGRLASRVGFQLSVAATAGILVGIPLWRERRPRFLWATLGATMAAQAAVAPLLLVHFGAVPLLAPSPAWWRRRWSPPPPTGSALLGAAHRPRRSRRDRAAQARGAADLLTRDQGGGADQALDPWRWCGAGCARCWLQSR